MIGKIFKNSSNFINFAKQYLKINILFRTFWDRLTSIRETIMILYNFRIHQHPFVFSSFYLPVTFVLINGNSNFFISIFSPITCCILIWTFTFVGTNNRLVIYMQYLCTLLSKLEIIVVQLDKNLKENKYLNYI